MTPVGRISVIAKYALLLVVIVAVQGILAYRIPVFRYLDLPLIYCIYYGFTRGKPAGAVAVGTVLGLMQDSLSGGAFGTNGFSKTLIAFLSASAGSKFDVDQPITRAIALILFTFLDSVLKVVLVAWAAPGQGERIGLDPGGLVLSAMFNTLVGLIVFATRRSRPNDVAA